MKEKKVRYSKNERFNKKIIEKIIIILIILSLIIFLTITFFRKRKTKDIEYNESGSIDYNITLTQNDFFADDSLPSNNQYIASIIDSININFKYNVQMKDMFLNYKYKYKIETQTQIIEKSTRNNIYDFKDILKNQEVVEPNADRFSIDDNISIDYKTYDTTVKKIVSTYDLNNVECKTVVKIYIDLLDQNGQISKTSTMSVSIPLNVKTVNIETENTIDNTKEKIFMKGEKIKSSKIFIAIAIMLLVIEIIKIKELIQEIKDNCPQEIINDITLKRILGSYGSYIQKVDGEFDFGKYDVLRVGKFEDLFKIREIIQNPILMIENTTKTKTYFVITTTTSMLYSYEINHGDVKELIG